MVNSTHLFNSITLVTSILSQVILNDLGSPTFTLRASTRKNLRGARNRSYDSRLFVISCFIVSRFGHMPPPPSMRSFHPTREFISFYYLHKSDFNNQKGERNGTAFSSLEQHTPPRSGRIQGRNSASSGASLKGRFRTRLN